MDWGNGGWMDGRVDGGMDGCFGTARWLVGLVDGLVLGETWSGVASRLRWCLYTLRCSALGIQGSSVYLMQVAYYQVRGEY